MQQQHLEQPLAADRHQRKDDRYRMAVVGATSFRLNYSCASKEGKSHWGLKESHYELGEALLARTRHAITDALLKLSNNRIPSVEANLQVPVPGATERSCSGQSPPVRTGDPLECSDTPIKAPQVLH